MERRETNDGNPFGRSAVTASTRGAHVHIRLAFIGLRRTVRLTARDRVVFCVRQLRDTGGAVAPGVVDTNPSEPEAGRVAFRPARVNRLLGTAIPAEEQAALLERVGLAVEAATGAELSVQVAAGEKPLAVTSPSASRANSSRIESTLLSDRRLAVTSPPRAAT